jgi:hypothetical protein
MQVIQHQELASAQASITFSSIPQTFTDLLLVYSVRTDNTNVPYSNTEIQINGSSANFTSRRIFGAGSGAGESYTSTNIAGLVSSASSTSNTFGSSNLYIPNYTGSTNKSYSVDSVGENNSTEAYQEMIAGLWSQTAAITQILIKPEQTRNFVQYSSITLYGILKGSSGTTVVS